MKYFILSLIIAAYGGAFLIAIIQLARGRFKVDYDQMAQDAMQKYLKEKQKG